MKCKVVVPQQKSIKIPVCCVGFRDAFPQGFKLDISPTLLNMPSKEMRIVEDNVTTPTSYSTTDVEELVAAIKHNLRLKSAPCHVVCTKQRRVSPYTIPVRTHRYLDNQHTCQIGYKKQSSDPYVLLQELLKQGTLIKEAVKRLQLGLSAKGKKLKMDEEDESGTNQCVSNVY